MKAKLQSDGLLLPNTSADNGDGTFSNPLIFADVPDLDIIRVEDVYYMVSTTMHMSPGAPIMKSYDLVNWEIINYVYAQLEDGDAYSLKNGKSDYSLGSWAASLRYDSYQKRFYVAFSCQSSQKTYFYSTADIEKGPWHRTIFEDNYYDNALLFVDNGQSMDKYIIYGTKRKENEKIYSQANVRQIFIDEQSWDVSVGESLMLIDGCNYENPPEGLWGEGFHAYKIGDYYYIFMIQGQAWQRQEIVWRSKELFTNQGWECRKIFAGNIVNSDGVDVMPSTGAAQGGIVDTPEGDCYAILFQDYGAVGRIPVMIPVVWDEEGWPVLGNGGKSVAETMPKPAQGKGIISIVENDDFDNIPKRRFYADDEIEEVTAGFDDEAWQELVAKNLSQDKLEELLSKNEFGYNGSNLKLVWQWNHNPNNHLWSLTDRAGWLRLKAGIISRNFLQARNTLTQRTYGPLSAAYTKLDTSNMREGDFAGLSLLQNQYGVVGVTVEQGQKYILMQRAQQKGDVEGKVMEKIALEQDVIYLGANCDFTEKIDNATFCYSLDGEKWYQIGDMLKMKYDLPHFMGYRFGLTYYPTKEIGGYADFDYFRAQDELLM